MTMVDYLPCMGRECAGTDTPHESNVGRRRDGECAVAVGGSSKCKVGQSEQHSALHTTAGIQVVRLYANLCMGETFGDLYQLYPIKAGKLIAKKEILQCL